jgi:hypothetical protein
MDEFTRMERRMGIWMTATIVLATGVVAVLLWAVVRIVLHATS